MNQQEADKIMKVLHKACALYIDSAEVIRLVLADIRQVIYSLVSDEKLYTKEEVSQIVAEAWKEKTWIKRRYLLSSKKR